MGCHWDAAFGLFAEDILSPLFVDVSCIALLPFFWVYTMFFFDTIVKLPFEFKLLEKIVHKRFGLTFA